MLLHFGLQNVPTTAPDYDCANFAATLKNYHHGGFIFSTSASEPALPLADVRVPCFTADECFVYLTSPPSPPSFGKR